MPDDTGKISEDELIGFADGLAVKATPSSVELASTKEGENHYIVRFPNNFFIFVKGDSIYELWKKRKLVEMKLFLRVADVEIESVTHIKSIEINPIPV